MRPDMTRFWMISVLDIFGTAFLNLFWSNPDFSTFKSKNQCFVVSFGSEPATCAKNAVIVVSFQILLQFSINLHDLEPGFLQISSIQPGLLRSPTRKIRVSNPDKKTLIRNQNSLMIIAHISARMLVQLTVTILFLIYSEQRF